MHCEIISAMILNIQEHFLSLQSRATHFNPLSGSHKTKNMIMIAQVIIEMHALLLVKDCIISCYNHSHEVIIILKH